MKLYENVNFDNIIGFLKFVNLRDYKSTLNNGPYFLDPYEFRKQDKGLSDAQMALEGDTTGVTIKELSAETNLSYEQSGQINKSNINYKVPVGGIYTKDFKKGFKFYKSNMSFETHDTLSDLRVKEAVSKVFGDNKCKFDVFLLPQYTACEKLDILSAKNCHPTISSNMEYKVVKTEIKYNKGKSNWYICCFSAITVNDINENGTLKKQVLKDLSGIKKNRKWIWIPKKVMLYNLKRIYEKYDCSIGMINYYDDVYPLTQWEILEDPYSIFFAKPRQYEGEKEFRILIGGPNDSFYSLSGNQSIPFDWKNSIKTGGIGRRLGKCNFKN